MTGSLIWTQSSIGRHCHCLMSPIPVTSHDNSNSRHCCELLSNARTVRCPVPRVTHRQTSVTQTLPFPSNYTELETATLRHSEQLLPCPLLYTISASSGLSVSCCPGSWCQHLSILFSSSPPICSLQETGDVIITNKTSCPYYNVKLS